MSSPMSLLGGHDAVFCGNPVGAVPLAFSSHVLLPQAPLWLGVRACPEDSMSMLVPFRTCTFVPKLDWTPTWRFGDANAAPFARVYAEPTTPKVGPAAVCAVPSGDAMWQNSIASAP